MHPCIISNSLTLSENPLAFPLLPSGTEAYRSHTTARLSHLSMPFMVFTLWGAIGGDTCVWGFHGLVGWEHAVYFLPGLCYNVLKREGKTIRSEWPHPQDVDPNTVTVH